MGSAPDLVKSENGIIFEVSGACLAFCAGIGPGAVPAQLPFRIIRNLHVIIDLGAVWSLGRLY